jgi:hypothetical protein
MASAAVNHGGIANSQHDVSRDRSGTEEFRGERSNGTGALFPLLHSYVLIRCCLERLAEAELQWRQKVI